MEEIERVAVQGVMWLKLGIELIGAVVIGLGCFTTAINLVQEARGRRPFSYGGLRLGLGRFLALGLEFQLAADILGTAISPSWEELGKLAAIATIRTALNFFLNRELKEQQEASRPAEEEPAMAAPRPVAAAPEPS